METNEISRAELQEMMKDAFVSILTERKDILEDAMSEAILDIMFGRAIEEGDTGEYSPEKEVITKLLD
ncbi:MAG: hypothetical protein JW927_08860 [Deltaproteobacteria bacterium]|nr:hypothetical protein [Deltaproteobacteria bacterium]